MMNALFFAVILLVIGLILLGWFLVRIIRRLTFVPIQGKTKKPPAGVSYLSIILAIILLACSWMLFWLGHELKSFHPFTPPGGIARIEVSNEGDPVKSIKVNFYTIDDEGQSKPTSFYLSGNSWKAKGQHVKISRQLAYIFNSEDFFKVTDFYGDYVGFKPPGSHAPLLGHETIAGGQTDIFEYVNLFSFLRRSFKVCEFETDAIVIGEHEIYNLMLADSCSISLDKVR